MATITKRTNKSGTYYYLVESARVNGKPRVVKQVYLGTAERIEKAMSSASGTASIPTPHQVMVYEFGAVAALYSIAERLSIAKIIDDVAGKRKQGLSVSSSILLAAINRAVAPTSKNSFFEWFDQTVLYKMFPGGSEKNLSSQGFWSNMAILDEDKIRRIEDEITKRIMELYDIDMECLLFDNTNFFTYLDSGNPSSLAKRGHGKEKRADLKIVGLSLMVSPYRNIPLFHEAYPGNSHDAQQFAEIINRLKDRYQMLNKGECTLTLVFDKGNNNEENIRLLLQSEPCPFHFVGGLRLNQCNELLDIPQSSYIPLGPPFSDETAYRGKKLVYGKEFTVVVTFNPELYNAQMAGILGNISTCKKALAALQERLRLRHAGSITKGKQPTVESITKSINRILSAEYMNDIIEVAGVTEQGCTPVISYTLNNERLTQIQERILGKTILFTDQHDWSNEQIVTAYRSQHHIEDAFRQMKDTKYLSFRPIRHFTDEHIRVHAFYCVLALMLTSLMNAELERMGHKMSIHRMLDEFQKAKQVISVYASHGKKPTMTTGYSRLEGIAKDYADAYNLLQYVEWS